MRKIFLILSVLILTTQNGFSQKSIVFPNSTATYGYASDNGALNLLSGKSFTISAWVKTSTATNQVFLAKRLQAKGAGYELWQLNGYFAVNCTHTNGSSSGLPGGSLYKINDGKWHQIAFVVDTVKNMYYMYVDAKVDVSKALVSTSGFTNTDNLYFGIRGTMNMPVDGSIDEVRIYNRALSKTELLADMASTVSSSTPGLTAAWNFEEGTGLLAADVKGVCNATLAGSPGWSTLTNPASQAITMNGPLNVAFGSPDFNPASSSSSMPVIYSVSDPLVATVVDGKIHIVGKGTCTITASQPENLYYTAAKPVSQTLNVISTLISFDHPFTSHAVIQRDKPVVISGKADPNDVLTLNLDGEIKTANVNSQGKWTCEFSAKTAKNVPFSLTASGLNSTAASLTDLLCGDVWVASGQSNMLMPIGPGYSLYGINNYSSVIAAANYPQIRFIQPVDLWQQASAPQTALLTSSAGWTVCSPSTAGGYSAVAYFFAKLIHLSQNVPVGIIQNAVGGTRIEAWTPLNGLKSIPEYSSWYTKATTTALPSGQVYDRKNFPTACYNGMLASYTHYPVKGIIWYQGEENLGIDGLSGVSLYGNKFRATIAAWRDALGIPDLPVFFVELANFKYSVNYAVLSGSREALPQFIAEQNKATRMERVYGVTISDISNYNDIHPTEKATVGIRLGNAALGYLYGKSIVPNAATFKEMRSEGTSLRISFNNNSGFYISGSTPLNEFKVAGPDKVYKTASAIISGNDILVSEPTVSQPLSVKFAWDENSNPNLFNGSGSPASRFNDSLKINRINFIPIPPALNRNDADIQLQATATSGLPVVFTTSNPNVANVENGYLHITGEGTVTITASESGNTVYAAAKPVAQTIQILNSTAVNNSGAANVTLKMNNRVARIDGIASGDYITLINTNGQIIRTEKAKTDSQFLDLNNIPDGNYFITIRNVKFVKTLKLAVM